MTQRYSREYNTETERASDPWAEETYSMEDQTPLPREGRGPVARGGTSPHHMAARGFAQTFGLHPAMAFLTVLVDTMVFGGDIASAGLLLPVSIGAGLALGVIVFLAQRRYYADDNDCALIKALIVGLVSIIPSPIPYALFLPAGIVGFFRRRR